MFDRKTTQNKPKPKQNKANKNKNSNKTQMSEGTLYSAHFSLYRFIA